MPIEKSLPLIFSLITSESCPNLPHWHWKCSSLLPFP